MYTIRCHYILSSSISSYRIYTNSLILFYCILFLKIIEDRTKLKEIGPVQLVVDILIHKGAEFT